MPGDCLNPILARYLGIHLFYYHMISNYAQGLIPQEETAKSIHKLYSETYPIISTEIELAPRTMLLSRLRTI